MLSMLGTPDEVARKLLDRYGDIAERISPVGYTADKGTAKAMAVALRKLLD